MITRLEIKGFKSLVDVKLDLGAVNIFIGANGSGKSNLLEAIGFLGAITSGMGAYEAMRYRGVRPGESSSYVCQLPSCLRRAIALTEVDSKITYSLEITPDGDHGWHVDNEMIIHREKQVMRRDGHSVMIGRENNARQIQSLGRNSTAAFSAIMLLSTLKNLGVKHFEAEHDLIEDSNNLFEGMMQYAIYTPSTPQLRGFIDDIHRDPLGLGGSGVAKAIEEMLQGDPKMLGPFDLDDVRDMIDWAEEVGTNFNDRTAGTAVSLRLEDRFMRDERNEISAVEASEGALYVLFMLALVGHERSPRTFAVDNFDQALHPRLAQKLTRMVCDQIVADGTRQMFATTHNPLVLNGLNLRDDRIRLFMVDRDAAGATVVNRVEVSEALMAKAEAGFALSEMWTMGWLGGGVPKNF